MTDAIAKHDVLVRIEKTVEEVYDYHHRELHSEDHFLRSLEIRRPSMDTVEQLNLNKR